MQDERSVHFSASVAGGHAPSLDAARSLFVVLGSSHKECMDYITTIYVGSLLPRDAIVLADLFGR